ncbi:MAG: RNA polymerase sigma factor [Pseudomonadota bacterium]
MRGYARQAQQGGRAAMTPQPAARLHRLSDAALMARVAKGDGPAFAVLLARHMGAQLAFAARVLGHGGQAEEAVQEAFLKVWVKAGRFDPAKAGFGTWLYRIVLNQCLDAKRRHRREVPLEAANDAPTPGDVEGEVIAASSRQAVARALAALPARQRAAIALCYFEGLSNAEAAAVLEVGVKALESLLSRGRAALKATLGPFKDDL